MDCAYKTFNTVLLHCLLYAASFVQHFFEVADVK